MTSSTDAMLEHAVRASVISMVDKRVMVTLRDGRHFLGQLRTFDQYGTFMLEGAVERKILDKVYTDVELGVFIVRGENMVMMGEMGNNESDEMPETYKRIPASEFKTLEVAASANKPKRATTIRQDNAMAID